jgi:hypothetical protein
MAVLNYRTCWGLQWAYHIQFPGTVKGNPGVKAWGRTASLKTYSQHLVAFYTSLLLAFEVLAPLQVEGTQGHPGPSREL